MIFVSQTRPVCTSFKKNSCTVRNSRAPMPTISHSSPVWRTKLARPLEGGKKPKNVGFTHKIKGISAQTACRMTLRRRL